MESLSGAVEEVLSKVNPTFKALMALVMAMSLGALGMKEYNDYRELRPFLERAIASQALRDSLQDRRMRDNSESIRRAAEAVRDLVFQICVDRADRVGGVTREETEDCRNQSMGVGR